MQSAFLVLSSVVTVFAFAASNETITVDCDSCPVPASKKPGDFVCNFHSTLCAYEQGCVYAGSPSWQKQNDYVEVKGMGGNYSAYSTLLSPEVDLERHSCIRFYFAQKLPSKLTIISNDKCLFKGRDEELSQMTLGEIDVPPGNLSLEIRGQNLAESRTWVQLKNMTLQTGTCKDTEPVWAGGIKTEQHFGVVVCLAVLVSSFRLTLF